MNSVRPPSSYRALKVTGSYKLNTAGTVIWAERLQWSGAQHWLSAKRSHVVADGILEGYKKIYGNFHFYWLLRSGHMVNTILTNPMP
jgi:carboxypeptidase C (cathepsin A)